MRLKYNGTYWAKAWREVALALLRDGYCAVDDVARWAKDNRMPLPMVRDVLKALELEPFEHDGAKYYRLSGRVVPLMPQHVRDVSMYRSAGREIGGTAA